MSFKKLQANRKEKEARALASAAVPPGEISTVSEVPNRAGADEQHVDAALQAQLVNLPEGTHRQLPPSLVVKQRTVSGRGIYAKEGFSRGSVLIAVRPHVSVLSTPCLDAYCSYCCGPAPSSGLKRCTRCRTVQYCNSTCQNSDWGLHKHECPALQRWAGAAPSPELAVPSDAVRCLGRVLWGIKNEGLDSTWTKEMQMMQSHRSSLPAAAVESHTHLAHAVVRYLDISSPAGLAPFGLNSAGDLVDLISRFTTNSFTLTSYTLTPIGVCLSPTMAFLNHSCEPNAVIVFPRSKRTHGREPSMQVIAIRDISPDEEVLTAYVDITLPKEARQKELKEIYNFTCHCNLCENPPEVDPRASMWCPKSCGGVCAIPTQENPVTHCTQCKAAVQCSDAVLDALRLGEEALQKALSCRSTDPAKAKQLTTNMLPILTSAGLTPSSHPLLAMTRLHQEMLTDALPTSMTQELLDETVRAAAKYSAGLSSTLSFGHPVRGVALAELGKLLAADEPSPPTTAQGAQAQFPPSGPARLKLAYETLVRSLEEVTIGFGKENGGGQIGNEIRETVVRLEKELGVWTTGVKSALEDKRMEMRSK